MKRKNIDIREVAENLIRIRKDDVQMMKLLDHLFAIEANEKDNSTVFFAHTLRKALLREWITEEIAIN